MAERWPPEAPEVDDVDLGDLSPEERQVVEVRRRIRARERPRTKPPAGACDTHIHVYGERRRYPHAETATSDPDERPVAAYRDVQHQLGLARVVVVQPSVYGLDNTCLVDAVQALNRSPDAKSDGCARGIGAVAPDTEEAELRDLSAAGMIGMRYMMIPGKMMFDLDTIERMAWRHHDHGWLAEIQLDGSNLHEVEQRLRGWPCPIVVDHIGKFLTSKSLSQAGFKALTRLIDRGRTWVKLSSPYESARTGRPDDPEVAAIARALAKWAPERMVWGSNWPHPDLLAEPPDDGMLLDLLPDWVDTERDRTRILVDNPAELFRFGPYVLEEE